MMDIEELKRLHADFPEINLSNFGVGEVDALNGWGIEVALMLPAIIAKLEAAQRLRDAVAKFRSLPVAQYDILYDALAAFDKEQQ